MFPVKAPKKKRPTRKAAVYWLERQGVNEIEVWMRRRPERGLLGGMMESPSDDWLEKPGEPEPPVRADWQAVSGKVVHVFTHFRLELDVYKAQANNPEEVSGDWIAISRLDSIALPTVMKKVADLVL